MPRDPDDSLDVNASGRPVVTSIGDATAYWTAPAARADEPIADDADYIDFQHAVVRMDAERPDSDAVLHDERSV